MTLTDAQWRSLVGHLRRLEGAYPGLYQEIEGLISDIERDNSVETFVLWARWRDAAGPKPKLGENPREWPPTLEAIIVRDSPITKAVVTSFVEDRTSRPAGIWVTRDPAGKVGWMRLEDYA